MEHYEMAELLSKKAGVSLERARQALEDSDWDMLDAMIALEREKNAEPAAVVVGGEAEDGPQTDRSEYFEPRRVKSQSGRSGAKEGFDRVWDYIKRLFHLSVDSSFVIVRHDRPILTLPVLALVILLVCCFWFTLPMLVIGLFFGCSYHFEKNADGGQTHSTDQ